MQLFLHIKITKEPLYSFYNKIPAAKSWVPAVTIFDMDNHSDSITVETAIKALKGSEKAFISIDAESGTELGGTLKILNQVMRMSSPVAIFYNGNHEMLDKIMFRMKDKQISNIPIEDAVVSFFNS